MNQQRLSGTGNLGFQDIRDSSIKITQYIGQSAEYQTMLKREEELAEMLEFYQAKGEEQKALAKSKELEAHREAIKEFKANVLRLADTFRSIKTNTERLRLAREHFEAGRFKEADAILKAEEMATEQESLLSEKQRLTHQIDETNEKLKANANEWLIKAQTTVLEKAEADWFERAQEYYEKSLKSFVEQENLFRYAYFLQEHKQYRRAITSYERLLETFGGQMEPEERATSLNNLGLLLSDNNRYGEAESHYAEALAIRRKLAETHPAAYLPDVAGSLNNLGILLKNNNRYVEAESHYEEALAIYRKLAETHPAAYLPDVAMSLNNLGLLLSDNNRYGEAESHYAEALAICRKLAETNPAAYLPDVATSLNNLGILLSDNNRYGEAESHYAEALAICRKLAETNPAAYDLAVCMTSLNLVLFYQQLQQSEKEDNFRWNPLELLADTRQRLSCFPPEHPTVQQYMAYVERLEQELL